MALARALVQHRLQPGNEHGPADTVATLQAACFARLAGSDAAMVRITLSLAEKALQLQPDNPHYVSAGGGVQDALLRSRAHSLWQTD